MKKLEAFYREISRKRFTNGLLTFIFGPPKNLNIFSKAELLITDGEGNIFISPYHILEDGTVKFNIINSEKVVLSSIDPATLRYLSQDSTISIPIEELGTFLENEYLLGIRYFPFST